MTDTINANSSAANHHPKPRTAAQAMGIKAPKIEPTKSEKMQALGKRASAISAEERDERRTRVLDFLQQVRVATRRDIDRVAGYIPGTTHNRVLETLYKRRLIERITNIDSSQTLYALSARGNAFASAPTSLPPLTTFEWQNYAQQEHRLGVARLMSMLLSPTPLHGELLGEGDDQLRETMLRGKYILLGEAQINASYAERFGKKKYPTPDRLEALYSRPKEAEGETPLAYASMLEEAWWYMIPPYLHTEKDEPIRALIGENNDTPLTPSTETVIMQRHPADAVIAPVSMHRGWAYAIEVERYRKTEAAYETTMSRYGSKLGRVRFGHVIWACADQSILNAVERAAEKTGTDDLVYAFVYDTGRRNGSFLQGTDFKAI